MGGCNVETHVIELGTCRGRPNAQADDHLEDHIKESPQMGGRRDPLPLFMDFHVGASLCIWASILNIQ